MQSLLIPVLTLDNFGKFAEECPTLNTPFKVRRWQSLVLTFHNHPQQLVIKLQHLYPMLDSQSWMDEKKYVIANITHSLD